MQSALILLLKYKYWILFPLAAIEGPLIALVVGFLVYTGTFNFILAYIILLFGDLVPDTIYYSIGFFGEKSKFIQKHFLNSKIISNNMDIIRKLWTNHAFKTMFLGKLAYGIAIPFLISAGMVKMSYQKFISLTIPLTLFQYGIIMTLGYYMGSSYKLATKYVEYSYFFLAFLVIVFIIAYVLLTRYARTKIISMENAEKKAG